jgi:hypothetical protein
LVLHLGVLEVLMVQILEAIPMVLILAAILGVIQIQVVIQMKMNIKIVSIDQILIVILLWN